MVQTSKNPQSDIISERLKRAKKNAFSFLRKRNEAIKSMTPDQLKDSYKENKELGISYN